MRSAAVVQTASRAISTSRRYLVFTQGQENRMMLCSGYVWDRHSITFPKHDITSPSDRGSLLTIFESLSNSGTGFAVPTNVRQRVNSLRFAYTNNNASGNPATPYLQIRDASNNMVWQWTPNVSVLGGNSLEINLMKGAWPAYNAALGQLTDALPDIDLPAGWQIKFFDTLASGSSIYSGVYVGIEQFVEP